MLLSLLGILSSHMSPAGAEPVSPCSAYVGKKIEARSFEEAIAKLPEIPAKSDYETTVQYQQRLTASPSFSSDPFFLKQTLKYRGISYNADKGELVVYDSAFGAGSVNFSNVFGYAGLKGNKDNFSSAVGFTVSEAELKTEILPATNGFGAKFEITRVTRQVDTVWEKPGKLGASIFENAKGFGPIARIKMSSDAARDLIENGSSMVLVAPRPPFKASGTSTIPAKLSSPSERIDNIRVMIADVRCAVLTNGNGIAVLTFSVI